MRLLVTCDGVWAELSPSTLTRLTGLTILCTSLGSFLGQKRHSRSGFEKREVAGRRATEAYAERGIRRLTSGVDVTGRPESDSIRQVPRTHLGLAAQVRVFARDGIRRAPLPGSLTPVENGPMSANRQAESRRTRSLLARTLGVLLAAAVASSAWILWLHAVPVFASPKGHVGHRSVLNLHVIGGAAMLIFGSTSLFIGWTRRFFRWHRWAGYGYLGLGTLGAATALHLSAASPHEPKSLYVATGTLAVVWLTVAAMALRAAINRRFDSHKHWVIRSYVLSWTFVGCRLAEDYSFFPGLGSEGGTATVWLGWIVPLVTCEIFLQWTAGSPSAKRRNF